MYVYAEVSVNVGHNCLVSSCFSLLVCRHRLSLLFISIFLLAFSLVIMFCLK
jgi:hypothetical protein